MNKGKIFPANLKSTRLILRRMTFDDIEFVFKHFSDPDVYRYLVDVEPVTNEREAKEIIKWASNPQDFSCDRCREIAA